MRRILALTFCVFTSSTGHAFDVWVDAANGSNANSGTSPAAVWQTITFALSQVPADETVRVLPRIYDAGLGEQFPGQPPG